MRLRVVAAGPLLVLAACGSGVRVQATGDAPTTAGDVATVAAATTTTQNELSRFCTSAAAILNRQSFSSNGADVVADLHTIDIDELSEADRQSFLTAIDQIDAAIYSFNNVDSLEGWSTRPVADIATRLCGTDMQAYYVMP